MKHLLSFCSCLVALGCGVPPLETTTQTGAVIGVIDASSADEVDKTPSPHPHHRQNDAGIDTRADAGIGTVHDGGLGYLVDAGRDVPDARVGCVPYVQTDPGLAPMFCPQRGFPPPVAHVTPGPHEYPDQLILKLIEGSHVRMVDGRLTIDPSQMLDEDPSLLACAGLDVPNAQCALVAIVSVLDANPRVSVERSFTRTPEDLDAERAQAGGLTLDKDHYLNDLNLYYVIHVPAEDAPGLYDAIYSNPLVDVLYFPGMPVLPGE